MVYKTAVYDSVSDLIEDAKEYKTLKEQTEFLKKYRTRSLDYFVNAFYNKDFTFMAGEIDHDYSKEFKGMEYSNIYKERVRLDTILKIGEKNQKTLKLCEILLESIPVEDADLIKTHLFNGEKLGINKKVFKGVYPDYFRF